MTPERIPGRTYAELGLALSGKKALSPDMQAWVKGMDIPDQEQGAKLTVPYQQSAWIYTAVSVIAENLSQIPFRISKLGGEQARRVRALRGSRAPQHRDYCRRVMEDTIIDSGEVFELFERPHPTMSKTLFWAQVASWDCLRGEFFILPLDEADQPVDLAERRPRVRRMLTLGTDMFWHMVVGYELTGWRYTGSPLMTPLPSEVLLPSEVIHDKTFNPYLYWRGMSPLSVALLPAMADYAAEMFMKGLLMNNADTGIIATTEQNLTQEQREQFMAALRERKRKAGTPDRPLFLSSGVKIEKPTVSNVDMQFLETRRLLRQEIGAIFKVPESLMGFSDSKSSALSGGGNALNEEKLTFIEQNIGPKCHRYEAALAPVIRSFGEDLVGWFDIEGLPIMQDARRMRVDSATKVWAMGVPFNLANQVYDLGFPALPWGDTGYLPFSVQPADMAGQPAAPAEDVAPTENENEEEAKQAAFERARSFLAREASVPSAQVRKPDTTRLWERHMAARRSSVKLFESKITKVLYQFRTKTLEKLAAIHLDKSFEAKSLIDVIFSPSEFGSALKVAVEHPIRMALETAVGGLISEMGSQDPWKMPPSKAVEYIHGRTQPVLGVGDTVRDQLNTSLEAGIQAGETTAELSNRVKGVFNNLSNTEAKRIALTETNCAFNFARHEAMVGVGVEYKSWLSSHGPTVRPAHALAEQTYMSDPIPVDEPFVVGGEQIMYPGDQAGSAGNVINCHCVHIGAQKVKEDAKGCTFKVFGLGEIFLPHAKE